MTAEAAEQSATPHFDRLALDGVRFLDARSPVPITLPAHTSLLSGLWPSTHGVRDNGLFEVAPDVPLLAESFERAGYQTGAFVSAAVLDHRYGLARGFAHYDDRVESIRGEIAVPTRPATEVVDAALARGREEPERAIHLVLLLAGDRRARLREARLVEGPAATLGLGGAGVIAAGLLYFLRDHTVERAPVQAVERDGEDEARLVPVVGPTTAGLVLRGSF